MRKMALACLVAGAVMVSACGSGRTSPHELSAEVEYPVAHFDRQVHIAPGPVDGALRQLAARIADVDGVAVAEVDYATRLIRVRLEPGLSPEAGQRVTGALRGFDGVASVEGGG
jgi:hypothetical protein